METITTLIRFGCAAAAALTLWGSVAAEESYVWRNVTIGGGGFVAGLVFHPTAKALLYARTDVGGAYRWDAAAQQWIPLTDWISAADNNLLGIESLALDPRDPQRLYLAAGTYSQGPAAILRSDDQGRTFQRTDVPFRMGGNELGRFNGERLAVDPNDGEILFFGSRHDGLWQSRDRGGAWQKVESFPSLNNPDAEGVAPTRWEWGRRQAVGIVSVVFAPFSGVPGRATQKLFAAVSTTQTNLYASGDGGVTWQAVPGQPTGWCPNHLIAGLDGKLYLSYGREPGPNDMSGGAVWRLNPATGSWSDITPLTSPDAGGSFGYGAVAVDAQHPATVMVTTFAHWRPHDLIFRSTDDGQHWTQLWKSDAAWDHTGAPYTKTRTPHWLGSIVIDPHHADQVWLTTGYGIWNCVNATEADAGRPTRWIFADAGLEETVPLALISPPEGAHLLSGVGDIDGFVHDDLTRSPVQGAFAGPRYGNTEDLAFAGKNPQVIARTGTGDHHRARAAVSRDGGRSWDELAAEPPTGNGAGTVALSADGRTLVWTPSGGAPYFTRDRGVHWQACAGLGMGVRVTADAVNDQLFYAFNWYSGEFCTSTNGAAGFTGASVLRSLAHPSQRWGGGLTIGATPGIEKDVWLASRDEGLFHSTNGGAGFVHMAHVVVADSLGFGRPAPGKNYPALFLAGTLGGRAALYRSDDAGVSWVRINDDQHQFGYISRVTGDPRIYGRVYVATGGRGVNYGDRKDGPSLGEN